MNNQIAIEIKGLTKEFDGKEVLRHCDLSIEAGEIYGILGANGAGKTTMLKLIGGLLEPTEGNIKIFGSSILTKEKDILREIGGLIEVPHFYEHLSAWENLSIHLEYMGVKGDILKSLSLVGLEDTKDKAVSKFSLGMRQRLGIARALIHNPKVLLLDEPINGIDPSGIREMRKLFKSLADEGKTILLSSHIISEIEQTVNRVVIISEGLIIDELNILELKSEHKEDLEDYIISKMNGRIEND